MTVEFEDFEQPEAVRAFLLSPGGAHAAELLSRISTAVHQGAEDPDTAQVVLTGNFAAAVQRRLPTTAPAYDTVRGSGMAVAKTMTRENGFIDVVIGAPVVLGPDGETEDERRTRTALVLHTATHEAQHVGMRQRGEDDGVSAFFLGQGKAADDFTFSGRVVLDEYRAELATTRLQPSPTPYWRSVLGALADFRDTLRDAIQLRYPGEPIGRRWTSAYMASHNIWQVFAYLAGSLEATGSAKDVPVRLSRSLLWERFAAPHWNDLATLLEQVPAGNERFAPAELESRVEELSQLLVRWLATIGFELRDTPRGPYFQVLRHDF